MIPEWLVRLIGCVTISIGFAWAYLCGREDRSEKKEEKQHYEPVDWPIRMEHEHGGDKDV